MNCQFSRVIALSHLPLNSWELTCLGCQKVMNLERRWLHELIVKNARCHEALRLQVVGGFVSPVSPLTSCSGAETPPPASALD